MSVDFFTFAQGYWARQDVYRWEAWGDSKEAGDFVAVPAGMRIHVGGWDTMTMCVARGFSISHDRAWSVGSYEVSARPRAIRWG